MSKIEFGIYDFNTSAQTTEPQVPDKSQNPETNPGNTYVGVLSHSFLLFRPVLVGHLTAYLQPE